MIKVLTVAGTRPEAIKLAPVIRALGERADEIESRVCVTAQHREMLDQVLELFAIHPDYDLDVMTDAQSPNQVASTIFSRLDAVLVDAKPDWVLVQGDTTTVMVASIAAFHHRIRVGHVEAGLRTGDKWQPFPEEVNRRIASAVADLHFAPTTVSRDNLLREGIDAEKIVVTGNTVIDALHWVSSISPDNKARAALESDDLFKKLATDRRKIVLVTAHRRENHGDPLKSICRAILDLSAQYKDDILFVYPVHMNPAVREPVHRMLGKHDGIVLTPPLDYLPLVHLMKQSHIVLTDSGGLQEEAPGLGKPVLVLRRTTERPEGLEAGTVRLVGTETDAIVSAVSKLLDDKSEYDRMAQATNPYGDGKASARIREALLAQPMIGDHEAERMPENLSSMRESTS